MIVGSGIDVIENRRVAHELAQGEWRAADGIFTNGELRYCNAVSQRALRFAQCFAAKEAACKALGARVSDLALFRDAEVVDRAGNWSLQLHGRLQAQAMAAGVRRTHLAVASTRLQTFAIAILES